MSRNAELELQLQQLLFTVNPTTAQPYSTNMFQVADGQGTHTYQTVFETISSQSMMDNAPLGYLPSTIFGISNDTSTVSSIVVTSYSTLSTMIGQGGIPGSITTYQLQSTVRWVQTTAQYVSSGQLVSSMTPFFDGTLSFMSNIQSTTVGLGSAGFVSTPTLFSTTTGLGQQDLSTLTGLGTVGYISTQSLQSTVLGLGNFNYISTNALFSTVTGMLYPVTSPGGFLGVVVTGTSNPPFRNFNVLLSNYLVTNNYFNSTNANSYGIVNGTQLPSTVTGLVSSLGSYNYVSTQTLLSTSKGIWDAKQNVTINNAGNLNIVNSQVNISSVRAIIFLSSFINSTVTYKGENGDLTAAVSGNSNMTFSTARLQFDAFSTFITTSSHVTVELYPTLTFDSLRSGALTSKLFPLTTSIQYGTNTLATTHQTRIAAANSLDGYSNYFQQPIKLTIPGSEILTATYANPFVASHYVEGGLDYNLNVGFRTADLSVYYPSTNSYFLSAQNLTF